MSRLILPPAPVANQNGLDKLYPSQSHAVPVDREQPGLTESDAFISDHGLGYDEFLALAARLKKSERSGRTGSGRRKRKATGA